MNKYIKELIETRLIDFGNNKILKSDRVNTYDLLSIVEKGDTIFIDNDDFIVNKIYNDDANIRYGLIKEKYKNAKLIGECICAGSEMKDGIPRVYGKYQWNDVTDAILKLSKVSLSNSANPKFIPELQDMPEKDTEYTGWENTELFGKYGYSSYDIIKDQGPYYYLPGIGELELIPSSSYIIGFRDLYVSSSVTHDQSYYKYIERSGEYLALYHTSMSCLPFVYMEYTKIKDVIK